MLHKCAADFKGEINNPAFGGRPLLGSGLDAWIGPFKDGLPLCCSLADEVIEWRCFVLQYMSPVMAQGGSPAMSAFAPLSGA
jgi:hypothetical protein